MSFFFSLDLTFNEIGEKGLCALANALIYNDRLRYIYLWGNEITKKAANVSRNKCYSYL